MPTKQAAQPWRRRGQKPAAAVSLGELPGFASKPASVLCYTLPGVNLPRGLRGSGGATCTAASLHAKAAAALSAYRQFRLGLCERSHPAGQASARTGAVQPVQEPNQKEDEALDSAQVTWLPPEFGVGRICPTGASCSVPNPVSCIRERSKDSCRSCGTLDSWLNCPLSIWVGPPNPTLKSYNCCRYAPSYEQPVAFARTFQGCQ